MAKVAFCALIVLVLLAPSITKAQEQTSAEIQSSLEDAGPMPADPLPDILADLRRTMKDPYSIRDFVLCKPKISQSFGGIGPGQHRQRAHWSVAFVLNAKNSYGGYVGATYFSAIYENGRLTSVGKPDLGPVLNAKLLELTKDCPRLPDARIQEMLTDQSANASKPGGSDQAH